MRLRLGRGCRWLVALTACGLSALPASAAQTPDIASLKALKALERDILLAPAMQERAEQAERARRRATAARRATGSLRRTVAPTPRRPPAQAPRRAAAGTSLTRPRDAFESRANAPARIAALPVHGAPANHVVNRRADDHFASTQSEVSIALWGRYGLAAWNDGEGVYSGQFIGYGYTTDGGRTWQDGGSPPVLNGIAVWTSDPVVTVDERTGTFYVCALATAADSARNAIAVLSAHVVEGVNASSLTFDTVELARVAGRDTLPDKPWIAVDPGSGNLYLSYTTFYGRGRAILDQIDVQRRVAGEAGWRAPIKLSPDVENGLVQGSRPAVGPDGEVHVIWKLVDTTEANRGRDEIRIRSSRDAGERWDLARDVASMFTNFGSGAPGYNRGFGFAFPGIAIDRSAAATRGRIYVTWNESLDFFSDVLGTLGGALEGAEPNDRTEVASPLALGTLVRGAIDVPGDLDFYRFHGNAGQTVIAHLDSTAAGLDLSLRLLSRDGQTWLAYCAPPLVRPRVIVFTLPITGDYFIGVGSRNDSTGAYRLATGVHRDGGGVGRARDHRDVFVATSDDGIAWRTPVRVNNEAPRYDDWMPEVAVDPAGRAWVAWYDWHDAPDSLSGGGSVAYLARSIDGGATWQTMGPMSSAVTPWSKVLTNLAPNQGDYISMFAGDSLVTVAWSDGRAGDPDIYASARSVSDEPIPPPQLPPSTVALELPRPNPTAGALIVRFELPATAPARVELLDAGGRPWRNVSLPAAAAGPMQVDLTPGTRLPPGLYFVRVAQGAASATHKVVVVR